MGFQIKDNISQSLSAADLAGNEALGESVLRGFLKPIEAFMDGKLDIPFGNFISDQVGCYLPVCMVKRFSEVPNSIPGENGKFIYDGFVLFNKNGSLAGLGIRLKHRNERWIIPQYFGKIRDVFRSPIKL